MLQVLAQKYDTDKKMDDGKPCRNGVRGHNYVQHYETVLSNRPIYTMLEIGVSFGSSIKMWEEYFPETKIYGIDISRQRFKGVTFKPNTKIIIGDATNKKVIDTLPMFDLIIDDGSHKDEDQLKSLVLLWNHLNKGGIYVVEDLHVSSRSNPFSCYNVLKRNDEVAFAENDTIAFIQKNR